MANHTISAKFEAKAGAGLGKMRPKPGGIVRVPNDIMHLVPQIATMIRDLRQVQYATAEERRAIEILSVLQVVRNYEAALAEAVLVKGERHLASIEERAAAIGEKPDSKLENVPNIGLPPRSSTDGIALNAVQHPDSGSTQEEIDQMPDINPEAVETVEIPEDKLPQSAKTETKSKSKK